MKKSLLFLSAMLLASASTFAQKPTSLKTDTRRAATTEYVKAQATPEAMAPVRDAKATNSVWQAPRRTVGDGLWYQRPEGSLYVSGSNSGTYWSYLYMPSFTEVTYKNMAEDKANTNWQFVANSGTYSPEQVGATVTEENDLKVLLPKIPEGYISSLYIPQLTKGKRTYIFGDGMNDDGDPISSQVALINGDTITSATDVNLAVGYYYGFSNGSSFGTTERTMTMEDGSNVPVRMNALYEFYKKPISPLCINEIFFRVVNYEGTPLMNDDTEMKVTVRKVNEDGSFGDVIAEMPFGMADATYVEKENGKTFGAFLVSQKETDAFGTEYAVPFIVKDEFVIIISGFEQDDVNFGLYMTGDLKGTDTDCFLNNGMVTPTCRSYVEKETGEMVDGLYYCQAITKEQSDQYNLEDGDTYDWTRHYNAVIHLYCMQDVVNIYEGFEKMIADPDGGVVYANIVETDPDTGQEVTNQYGTVQYQSTLPRLSTWEGYEGEENYQFEGLPEWIKVVEHIDTYYDEEYDYTTLTQLEADPLPEGVKGRKAEIHITSERGADGVFEVIQGEVEEEQEGDIYDFAAAAAAEENPENLNGGAAQKFAFFDIANDKDDARQDFKGYTNYEGTNLPAEGHIWRRTDRINGNVKDGGLQCPNNRVMVIDGLKNGAEVTIEYTTAEDGKNIVFCPAKAQKDEWTINGETPEIGVTEIPSGAKVVVTKSWDGYFAFQVFKGMVITKITVKNNSEDTAIREVRNEKIVNSAIFNLAGQRISAPVRGQIYIKNGKKYMAK